MKTKIIDLSHDGRGIGQVDGKIIFVQDAYPGEEVEVEITKTKKNYLEGRTKEILKKSADRIESRCPDFYHCNGCQYCDYTYQAQLESKISRLKANLKKFAGLELAEIKIHPMENYHNYRNHVQLKVKDRTIGYVDKENYSVFQPKACLIWPEKTPEVIEVLKNLPDLDKINLIGLRENYKGDLMVILVTKDEKGLKIKDQLEDLKDLGVSHIYQNINSNPRFHYGRKSKVLYGDGFFKEEILKNTFNLSPTSFFQVNRTQAETLYKIGIENLSLKSTDKVLELYSGIGTISMGLAKQAAYVLGIEYNQEAVADAKTNAKLNGLDNLDFKAGKAEDLLDKVSSDFNKILLDPARAGADKKVLEKILEIAPEKISYISCDPATLCRDLGILIKDGLYKVDKVEIVDMFPLSSHTECVCRLEKE